MKGYILIIAFFAYTSTKCLASGEDLLAKELQTSGKAFQNTSVVQSWEAMEKKAKDISSHAVKMVLPSLMHYAHTLNISNKCMKESMHLISGIKNIKPWALRFLDSSAKIMDGILVGTLSAFGSYDECVDTEVKSTKSSDKGKLLFRGQYCTIDFKPPLPSGPMSYNMHSMIDELTPFSERDTAFAELSKLAHFFDFLSLRFGICTPSGCSQEDVNKTANLLGEALSITASVKRCEVKEENDFTPVVKAVIACYSFVGLVVLSATLVDIYIYYKKAVFKSRWIHALLAFSFISNFRKFTNTSTASDTLSCLNGIRFLSMSWVILAHTYLTLNYQMFHGFTKARNYLKDFAFQAVVNASLVVDTFFFIGGLLVCYLTIKLVRVQGRKFNVILYIFHRLWRIIPFYAFAIMFMFLINLLGSGPIWHETTHKHIKGCYDNWWTNLIFINNFYDAQNMCILQSWYLAVDFQLYIGALIILLPMIRWPKIGVMLSIFVIFASVVYSGIGTYVNNYPPTMLIAVLDMRRMLDYWAHYYFQPFAHAGPYCVGLLAGYLLAIKPDLKIPFNIQLFGWSIAFITNFSVLYGVVEWNRGAEPEFWSSIFYASLNRTAWTLGIAWMVICCATGHGGVINHILSWKVFVPLGRLTYTAYLLHPIVQLVVIGNVRTDLQPDQFLAVWVFCGHLFVNYASAFAGSMLIEAPFMSLEKLFLRNAEKETDSSSSLATETSIIKDSLKSEKNCDIGAKMPTTEKELGGIEYIVYKL